MSSTGAGWTPGVAPPWQPATRYVAGQIAISPGVANPPNALIYATSTFVSAATWAADVANWVGLAALAPGTYVPLSAEGTPNGVATLDAGGHVPAALTRPTLDPLYVGRDATKDFAGDVTTPLAKFAAFSAQVAAHGNVNGIVGMAINDTAAATVGFPTGVTGCARVDNPGNAGFGIFGVGELHAAGVATNELNAFNYAAAPAGTYPPDRSIGTVDHLPIVLTIASGGNFPTAIGIHFAREGSVPQPMKTGIYANPDALTDFGIFLDATAATGPTTGLRVNIKNAAVGLDVRAFAGQAADLADFFLNGILVTRITPTGGFKCSTDATGTGTGDTVLAILNKDHSQAKSMRVDATGNLQILNNAFSTVIANLDDAGRLSLTAGLAFTPATTNVAPGAGGAGALPATPAGYMTITVGGTDRKVAYY
jgi:hypothetical protein